VKDVARLEAYQRDRTDEDIKVVIIQRDNADTMSKIKANARVPRTVVPDAVSMALRRRS
jgi:hypothetical protein